MRRVEELWGTAIGVEVVDDVDPEVVDALYRWFERVDELFSTWRDDSEISRIGRGELPSRDASPDVATVLALCDDVCGLSGGAFDITFGARAAIDPRPGLGPLDPSGLAKGWAVERAATMLLDAGARSFCINAGGDVAVRGRPSSDDAWRIGIQHPWSATSSPPWSASSTARSQPLGATSAATTSSIRAPGCPRTVSRR